jgi:Ca2+:H+ antiporter
LTAPDIARVVETARRAAAAAHHAFVGTEHLLAAALTTADGSAARALGSAGVSLDGLAEELLTGLPSAEGDQSGPPPMSRFAERAVADAEKSGNSLPAVLLRSPKGRIASVLTRRGADLQLLRRALEPERAAGTASAPQPASQPKRPQPKPDRRPAAASPASAQEPPRGERRLPPHLEPRKSRPGLGGFWLLLLLAVPASVVLEWQGMSPLLVFVTACVGVLPLARLMGEATEQLAERTGPTIGGLLNATFGNAAELIIALVALQAGLVGLVKASITGSILGNLLLILGLSLIAGGTRTPILKFSRTSAGMSSAMLALAVVGLVFPALFHGLHPGLDTARFKLSELGLSEVVAMILATTYGFSLLFSLHTHKTLFGVDPASTPEGATWSVGRSILVLAAATVGTVIASELLVHSVGGVTSRLGLSETFLGLIVIPIIGNAAEHATAVMMARRGKTDLSLQIALGSSTQVALLVAPLLVLAGLLIGQPLDLVFTPLEVVALGVSTIVVAIITLDGESHWFEGVQLLALYGMVGAAAYFL